MDEPRHRAPSGYWDSPWPAEDGGPTRRAVPHRRGGTGLIPGGAVEVVHREVFAATMVVLRDPGETYLLRHTIGADATCWVERIDGDSLEEVERSPDLGGGPWWPGGVAVHANGDLYVVFDHHAHRLAPDCSVVASRRLPRDRPYNSFVVLDDGTIVTKDFGKDTDEPAELLALEPEGLEIVDRLVLPERSIARLSAHGTTTYVVGDRSLLRARWDGATLALDDGFSPVYVTEEGQTYGWDVVLAAGAGWLLDDGEGTEGFQGSFRGVSSSPGPLHLVRIGLDDAAVTLTEVCGRPNGIVANPPLVDTTRNLAVAFDSANAVLAAFRFDGDGVVDPAPVWSRSQGHGAHFLLYPDTGEVVTMDHEPDRVGEHGEEVVVVDIETGTELVRAATNSPLQSVVFPAPAWSGGVHTVSFASLTCVRPA